MSFFEKTLFDFGRGKATVDQAHRALRDRAHFSFRTNPSFVNWDVPLEPELRVPLTVTDIRSALHRYLDGTRSADELQDWGEFITLVSAYSLPEPPAENEDYYDAAWDVIHELSSPLVHGDITPESAKEQLSRLSHYP